MLKKEKKRVIHRVEMLGSKTCREENVIEEIQGPSSEWKTGIAGVGTSLLFIVDEHRGLRLRSKERRD